MQKFSRFKNSIFSAFLLSLPLSFLISILFLPFGEIIENGYFKAGFYNTILNFIFKTFFSVIPITILITWLIYFIFPKIRSKHSKTTNTILLILSILVLILFAFNFYKKIEKNPNLIFIVVDTLRDDHTSFESPQLQTTESLKSLLLKKGVYFKNSHSNAPWTLPSISSMITSKFPSELGIKNLVSKINKKEFTLAELMKENGYKTCSIISHILLKKTYGFSQGYDIYNEKNISDKFGNHFSISSPGVTRDAIDFIQKNKSKKFFLFLHYFDPHYIYIDHEKKFGYKGSFTSKDISFLRKQIRLKNYSANDIDYLKYCYDTEIRFTDTYIGKFIKELKKQNLFDNTLIVFTSDHGEEFVERGWLGHSTTLNSEQTNVPLIIKPPLNYKRDVKPYGNINVSNIDIIPTISSILKIKHIPVLSGKNIFSDKKYENPVFAEVSQKEFGTDIELISVIWKPWKLIKDLTGKKYFLYNIISDPAEQIDLYKSFPNIESKLKFKLMKWEKSIRKTKKISKRKKPLSEKERKRLKTLGYIN